MMMLQFSAGNYNNNNTICFLLLIITTSHHLFQGVIGSANEARLLSQLFKDYDKIERPAVEDSDAVDVDVTVYLRQIMDVEETLQIIQSNLWLHLKWHDYRLKWQPEDHGHITRLIVPIEKVWCPDILLHNSANDKFDPTFKVNVEIFYDGEVRYMPPGIFSSTCQFDIQYFPFDTQRCKMKFSSWTYNMAQINMTLPVGYADTSSYIPNGEWELVAAPVTRNEETFEDQVYVDVTYTIIIARRPLYYLFNLVLPTVLISMIALVTFALPVDSGEKVALSVMVLLSIIMFLNLVMEQLPATSDAIPLLSLYFGGSTMLLSICVFSNIMVLNIHYRTPAVCKFPSWIRVWINHRLAFLLRMKRPPPFQLLLIGEEAEEIGYTSNDDEEDDELERRQQQSAFPLAASAIISDSAPTLIPSSKMPSSLPPDGQIIKWQMRQCAREIRTIRKARQKNDEKASVCEEWKFAASVIERLCFFLLSAMVFCLTCVIVVFTIRHL